MRNVENFATARIEAAVKRLREETGFHHASDAAEVFYGRYQRDRACRIVLGDEKDHPAAIRYILDGTVLYNGFIETAPLVIDALVAIDDIFGADVAANAKIDPRLTREYQDWCLERQARRHAIWKAGLDPVETIDPETGEVTVVGVDRDRTRQPPVVDGQGHEVPYPGFKQGGLAFRARATRPRPEGEH